MADENWFDRAVGGIGDIFGTVTGGLGNLATDIFGENVDLGALGSLAVSLGLQSGAFDDILQSTGLDFLIPGEQNRPVGYQGGIPEYVAVRERIPQENIAPPRPGAMGQRYFSDTIFAQKPKSMMTPPTLEQAQSQTRAQALGLGALNPTAANTPARMQPAPGDNNAENGGDVELRAAGGLLGLAKGGYYLGGPTDGMADKVPARIDGRQEARLSDGEFVVPADVVSHLGNGNSNAGAQQLYAMMDRVRKARTGREAQGRQINPSKYMPGMRAQA